MSKQVDSVHLQPREIENLFVSAVEGGSNYWCVKIRPLDKNDKRSYSDYMADGFTLTTNEAHENDEHGEGILKYTVTKDDIKEAGRLMCVNHLKHYRDIIQENDDSETGDVFLQLCAFKKVVFG